ncbi:MAG: bifunctional phosphopantothenoylcysteine decarboxylase/phosphopantothenate--cysteine ligase CoaBC [Pseudomonadota bacterium]
MSSFPYQHIVLGVSGGIAAYKSAELVRLLVKQGASVRVVLTHGASEFITPMTLQALSGHSVHSELFSEEAEAAMGHIELAKWADLILIAPATAHTIAKLRHGFADDLLTTLCLATDAPVVIAPAMNQAMWHHAQTQRNVTHCTEVLDHSILGPGSGEQACGDVGFGRMLEPSDIVSALSQQPLHNNRSALSGKHVVITAGPTRETIDPVRFLSNPSTGKMGFALAQAAAKAGAQVTLIAGPVALPTPQNVTRIDITTAQDMYDAAMNQSADIFIGCAAVADYRPQTAQSHKIKKMDDVMQIELVRNPDILESVAKQNNPPFCIGFAAETQHIKEYALKKMDSKQLSMIISNDVSNPDIGFSSEQNQVNVFWKDLNGEIEHAQLERMDKRALGTHLINMICDVFSTQP